MPTNYFNDRVTEITALAAVESQLANLGALVREPNAKRYNHSLTVRRERWLQLASVCERQAQLLDEPPVARKARRVKVVPTEPTSEPTTQASA